MIPNAAAIPTAKIPLPISRGRAAIVAAADFEELEGAAPVVAAAEALELTELDAAGAVKLDGSSVPQFCCLF